MILIRLACFTRSAQRITLSKHVNGNRRRRFKRASRAHAAG